MSKAQKLIIRHLRICIRSSDSAHCVIRCNQLQSIR